MNYAIAVGCSHTLGVGNSLGECYVDYLATHYQMPIHNHAVAGGNHNTILETIIDAVQQSTKPNFIIAQWPNIIRRTAWINGQKELQNINAHDESFSLLLKNGEENFLEPWIQSIIVGNLLCRQAKIPIINIILESIDRQILNRLDNIKMHTDEKLPGCTWLFDSAAQDHYHHSPKCHRQWAERLIGIINETTKR